MGDYIEFERIWQDNDFFEMKITCSSDYITATTNIYTTNQSINNLINGLCTFIHGKIDTCFWKNGEKGDDTTAYVSMEFIKKDSFGHIQIEIYMELNDGGSPSKHHCCFFVNTELGLLEKFQKDFHKIQMPFLGTKIALNK